MIAGYLMSRTRHKSYLKTYRRKAGLTQPELGGLLGVTANAISKYECGKRSIPAEVLAASEVIFGVSATKLFPALFNNVDEDLAIRALDLHQRLAGRQDPVSIKKLALIAGIPGRLR